ncbi:hypothetical protein BASA81_011268 [Batrachochytrium salamandrivorans]|nr:hypothetical protein BASA81_011268 [Batrachochytrium salamandrivorans]
MKRVLVSGCFDLLHSGHVEFFREASQLGELHVRIGSDANIQLLKHHQPMFPQTERLEMVRAVRYVHSAEISLGTGEFDFVEDFKQVKPHVYFVNEDCSKLEQRKRICQELGIEVIVHQRLPSLGLEPRSSTSIKKQLKLSGEEDSVVPWRLCFAGGWMDLDWCNALCPGCVITINIQYHPNICRDQCGLATSSRKHFKRLWPDGRLPVGLDSKQAAVYLWGAENADHFALQTKPYVAGSQDHIGLMYSGINRLDYADGSFWPHTITTLADNEDVYAWLESVLYIVDIPFVSRPGADYNSQRVNNLTDLQVPLPVKRRMVESLATASNQAWEAVLAKDCAKLGSALSDNMLAWEAMLPYTVDPYLLGDENKSRELKQFWKQYDRPFTKGCLFTGAGGGFLMVINDQPVLGSFQVKINRPK